MDAPDLVKLMADLDDEPEEGVEIKVIVVAHGVGDWVMRFGEMETKASGDVFMSVEIGRVVAIRINRRGVAYRVAWRRGYRRLEWRRGDELEGLDEPGD